MQCTYTPLKMRWRPTSNQKRVLERILYSLLQGIAGNKKDEFWVEAQFLSKLHTSNG
jgi:hypothetical protein